MSNEMEYSTIIHILILSLISYLGIIETCSLNKTLTPAYALIDNSSLPYLFASCTITPEAQQMEFDECVFLCQQDETCVAMHHEDQNHCKICRTNGNVVNSLTFAELRQSSFDEHEQTQYFVALEYLMDIRIEVMHNCQDVRSLLSTSQDGEYCLSIDRSPTDGTRIYCNGLDTTTPESYLTLPAGPDDNFSFTTHHSNRQSGRIKYDKLGLDLINMRINSWDDTFANQNMTPGIGDPWINPYPAYGKAWSCVTIGRGSFSINLTGTGFYIPDSVQWLPIEVNYGMNFEVRTGQEVVAECYGNCGGCVPSSDGDDEYRTPERQTIEVRYDTELDATACAPEWLAVFVP